jgi:dUTPase
MEDPFLLSNLLKIYDKIMYLKVYVDEDNELKNIYSEAAKKHNQKLQQAQAQAEEQTHINAGFDLYTPGPEPEDAEEFGDRIACYGTYWTDAGPVNKIDFKIQCSAQMHTDTNKVYNTGFYMYPRSSLSKTQLRLANSVGIIDAGYRGHVMGMFDVANVCENDENEDRDADCFVEKFDRLVQICAPSLVPIYVEIVDTLEELGEKTERGTGGFGSTGK